MKKAVVFAALLSAGLGSGAATAYPVGAARTVNVALIEPTSAGAITAGGAFNTGQSSSSGCLYPVSWQSPFPGGNSVSCSLVETRTVTNPTCSASTVGYTPGAFLSTVSPPGPFQKKGGLGSGCAGFDANGTQYSSDIVISAIEGIDRASGIITYPAPFGAPYPVTL